MKKHQLFTILLLVFCSARGFMQVHSLTTELRPLYDLSLLPVYPEHSTSAQVSSYDITGGNDDGFSGKYSFIRRNEDSTLVIFDVKGAGVINRMWTPTPSEDTLDFYIDTETKPSFSIKYLDLFSGKRYPFVSPLCGNQLGGYYCYLPIPFSKNCKIVYRGKKTQFHQIQYRLYSSSVEVKQFSLDLNPEEKQALHTIETLWNKKTKNYVDFYSKNPLIIEKKVQLAPNASYTLINLKKGGRILGIEIEPANVFEGIYKQISLKITWDGEKTPAVNCPVADFFGYAFGKTSMQSLMMGTQENKNYCYLPMPYDTSATIEFFYTPAPGTTNPIITFKARVLYSNEKKRNNEGKFYTQWNKVLQSEPGKPHVLADLRGKGHYIGTILQAQGLQPGMTYFFEGDDSTVIDGSMRLHGTGSEDYFNGGWYALMDRWDGRMSLPLHGALDYSLPFCRTGGYRFYPGDKLSFEKSFYHSIEHGPTGNMIPAEYTSLGLYYCSVPPASSLNPTSALTKVYLPDTMIIYPQLMDYNIAGNVDIKTSWKYGTGGESYLFTPGNESAIRISLKDIPKGHYALYVDINKSSTGCNFSIWQRQTMISDWFSTKSDHEERIKDLFIKDIHLSDFENTISIRFKTGDEKNSLLLHRIKMIKI
ncbi:MAG: glycoside hydrolase family 172 protein [Saprospiraceae bacterium]